MNIEMDECAKRKLLESNNPEGRKIPHEGWVCSIGSNQTIKHLTKALCKQLNGIPLLNHWALKHWFQKGQVAKVNWEMATRAMALP